MSKLFKGTAYKIGNAINYNLPVKFTEPLKLDELKDFGKTDKPGASLLTLLSTKG